MNKARLNTQQILDAKSKWEVHITDALFESEQSGKEVQLAFLEGTYILYEGQGRIKFTHPDLLNGSLTFTDLTQAREIALFTIMSGLYELPAAIVGYRDAERVYFGVGLTPHEIDQGRNWIIDPNGDGWLFANYEDEQWLYAQETDKSQAYWVKYACFSALMVEVGKLYVCHYLVDSDGDGSPENWELVEDPYNPASFEGPAEGDGFSDYLEYCLETGTDPLSELLTDFTILVEKTVVIRYVETTCNGHTDRKLVVVGEKKADGSIEPPHWDWAHEQFYWVPFVEEWQATAPGDNGEIKVVADMKNWPLSPDTNGELFEYTNKFLNRDDVAKAKAVRLCAAKLLDMDYED